MATGRNLTLALRRQSATFFGRSHISNRWIPIAAPWAVLLLVAAPLALRAEDDYSLHIKPLLRAKCSACHGALKQEAGLRLDAGRLIWEGGESGAIIDARHPKQSLVLERITSDDVDYRMPPEGEGEPLTPPQVQRLEAWIRAGAAFPESEVIPQPPEKHWSYQPIARPALPSPTASENPIDAFVEANLRSAGLKSVALADPRTRLRRVTLDLIGLLPSVAEQRQFQADDSAQAWRQIVDELLDHPAYGERWGRHWMDVWRYSDWDGYKNQLRGSQRHIWRWRDWIIQSLNADKGYDQMIVEMLAGDELAPNDLDTVRATGFLARNYHHSNRDIWLDATVEHTAKAFLATTVNCARCHDHKYDPIAQEDYYAMRAIFEPHHVRTERLPGQPDLIQQGLARVFDQKLDAVTYLYQGGNEKHPDKDNPIDAGVPLKLPLPFEIQPVSLPLEAAYPSLRGFVEQEDLAAAREEVKAAERQLVAVPRGQPQEIDMASKQLAVAKAELDSLHARWQADRHKLQGEPDDNWLMKLTTAAILAEQAAAMARVELEVAKKRRDLRLAAAMGEEAVKKARDELDKAEKKREQTRAAHDDGERRYTPAVTGHPTKSTGRRLALARWITHPQNPLTARVCVNHIWMRHFGRPLVDNVFDFGLRSEPPIQLPLLDFLASELIRSNWSMKHIHRLVVTSHTYQRKSSGLIQETDTNRRRDPDNQLFWRTNVRRLEGEIIRDSMLHAAGQLDAQQGGPDLDYAQGESVPRRSVYFQHAYEKQMTMLTIFDGAGTTECYQRSESVIPQQALALSNSALTVSLSRRLSRQLTREHPEEEDFVNAAFEMLLTRTCRERERQSSLRFLKHQAALLSDPDRLTPHGGNVEASVAAASSPALRARENFVHVLLNHNDFVTVR